MCSRRAAMNGQEILALNPLCSIFAEKDGYVISFRGRRKTIRINPKTFDRLVKPYESLLATKFLSRQRPTLEESKWLLTEEVLVPGGRQETFLVCGRWPPATPAIRSVTRWFFLSSFLAGNALWVWWLFGKETRTMGWLLRQMMQHFQAGLVLCLPMLWVFFIGIHELFHVIACYATGARLGRTRLRLGFPLVVTEVSQLAQLGPGARILVVGAGMMGEYILAGVLLSLHRWFQTGHGEGIVFETIVLAIFAFEMFMNLLTPGSDGRLLVRQFTARHRDTFQRGETSNA